MAIETSRTESASHTRIPHNTAHIRALTATSRRITFTTPRVTVSVAQQEWLPG